MATATRPNNPPAAAGRPTSTRAASGAPYRRGVGLVLFNRAGLVLCAERADMPGAWQFPQGGIQVGETPAQAAVRELREELGVDPARVEILAEMPGWSRYDFPDYIAGQAFFGKYRGQEQKWFALLFTGEDGDIRLKNDHQHEGPEFVRFTWQKLTDTPAQIVEFKRPVYESVVAAFAAWPARLQRSGGRAPRPWWRIFGFLTRRR